MKNKTMMKVQIVTCAVVVLMLCSCHTSAPQKELSAEMAFEGVNNYCHKEYDWTPAKENPDIMSVTMGEETDSAYLVIFRSYTGASTYFYVDKTTGTTRLVEYVPALRLKNEAGTIHLFDYLVKD